jgi:hypothetical protein
MFFDLNICQVNVKSFLKGRITWKIRDKTLVCCVSMLIVFIARSSAQQFLAKIR